MKHPSTTPKGRAQPAFGRAQPAFGRAQPAFGKPSAAFGKPLAAFGKAQPAFGKPSAAFGKPSAAIGKPSAAIGKAQSVSRKVMRPAIKPPISCQNCGLDHKQSKCTQPITSYGMIHAEVDFFGAEHGFIEFMASKYRSMESADHADMEPPKYGTPSMVSLHQLLEQYVKFVVVSRRLSLGFSQFARGMYQPTDPSTIISLFRQMYPREREIIATRDYHKIVAHYENLRGSISHKYMVRKFHIPYIKFRSLIVNGSQYNLSYYLAIDPDHSQDEWGFPKGRMHRNREHPLDCATREFCEETGRRPDQITVLNSIGPVEENMIGTNGLPYRHVYYLSLSASPSEGTKYVPDPMEIGRVRSVCYQEAIQMIRPYHTEKKRVMRQVFHFVISQLVRHFFPQPT